MTESLDLSRPGEADALYRRVIDAYGRESQTNAIIEEAAKLIFAICKQRRAAARGEPGGKMRDAVIEEIADMEIALGQAKLIYCGDSPGAMQEFETVKLRKLEKLAARREPASRPVPRRGRGNEIVRTKKRVAPASDRAMSFASPGHR